MPAFDPERFEKLLACKRAAMEYLSHCPSEELDEAERLLCVEVANCAEALRRRGRGGNAAAREGSPHPEAPLNAAGSAPRSGAPLSAVGSAPRPKTPLNAAGSAPRPEAPFSAADGAPCPAAHDRAADGTPRPGAVAPRPADGDPLDVDYLDCPPRDGGAVYCP